MKSAFSYIFILLLSIFSLNAQNYSDSLNQALETIIEESAIPGCGVAIVSEEKILYQSGFGWADVEQQAPFTTQTVLNIGSLTKTLISFTLLKLVEEGKLALDDPINLYLPFPVHNPYFPEDPITIRQLATHTASLTDGKDDMLIEKTYLFRGAIDFQEKDLPEDYFPYFQIYQTNHPLSMGRFLHDSYCPEGRWYDSANFLDAPPGTTYHYTNLGSTLLAYLIEQVAGQSFASYSRQVLLEPLGMSNTYWSVDEVPDDRLSSLYLSNDQLIPHYSLITYPDGGLLTSVADFSLYLMEMIKGLAGNGSLLRTSSYQEIMQDQLTEEHFPNGQFERSKGMNWSVNPEGDNISMNGSDPGILTYTLFTTAGNLGIVIFMNTNLDGEESREEVFFKVRATLFQFAGKLLKG